MTSFRHQIWTGWPDSVTDDKIMLASADLDLPEHKLSVQRAPQPPSSPSPSPEAKRKVSFKTSVLFHKICVLSWFF